MKAKKNQKEAAQKKKPAVDLDNEATVQLLELGQSKKKKKIRQMGIAAAIILVGIISCFVIYPNMNSGARSVRAAEKAMEENDYDTAVKEFSHAIEIKKDDASLYLKRSDAYLKRAAAKKGSDKKTDIKNAEADAKKASKLNPKGTEERIQLATVYAEDGATDREEKTLQEAAEKTGKAYLYNASISMGNTRMNLANNGLIVCDLDGNTYIANSPKVGSVEKVDKDGSGTVIYEEGEDVPISYLNLRGNKLIFQCDSTSWEEPERIVSVDVDGKNARTLFVGKGTAGKTIIYDAPVICGNRLYINYFNSEEQNDLPHNDNVKGNYNAISTTLNGENRSEKSCKQFELVRWFSPSMDVVSKKLCSGKRRFMLRPKFADESSKISVLDGKNEKILLQSRSRSIAATIQGDTIYVCTGPDKNGFIGIDLYDLNGNLKDHCDAELNVDPEEIKTLSLKIVNLCVNEDRLYYDLQGNGVYYAFGNMKKDGTDNKLAECERENTGSSDDDYYDADDDDYYDDDEY